MEMDIRFEAQNPDDLRVRVTIECTLHDWRYILRDLQSASVQSTSFAAALREMINRMEATYVGP